MSSAHPSAPGERNDTSRGLALLPASVRSRVKPRFPELAQSPDPAQLPQVLSHPLTGPLCGLVNEQETQAAQPHVFLVASPGGRGASRLVSNRWGKKIPAPPPSRHLPLTNTALDSTGLGCLIRPCSFSLLLSPADGWGPQVERGLGSLCSLLRAVRLTGLGVSSGSH